MHYLLRWDISMTLRTIFILRWTLDFYLHLGDLRQSLLIPRIPGTWDPLMTSANWWPSFSTFDDPHLSHLSHLPPVPSTLSNSKSSMPMRSLPRMFTGKKNKTKLAMQMSKQYFPVLFNHECHFGDVFLLPVSMSPENGDGNSPSILKIAISL